MLALPDDARPDPTWFRTKGEVVGRDGCRVPIPWSGDAPPYGFTSGTPWLPQPQGWGPLSAQAQAADAQSTQAIYRRALAARRASAVLGDGELVWRRSGFDDVLALERPGESPVLVVLNTSDESRVVDVTGEVLVANTEVVRDDSGALVVPPDCCVWISLTGSCGTAPGPSPGSPS